MNQSSPSASASAPDPIRVFIGYAREDQEFRDDLVKELIDQERRGIIKLFADHRIVAGEPWDRAIRDELANADLILFLMSRDSIASEYINSVEVKIALARHRKGEARVFPIIVRRCDWKSTDLANLQAVPRTTKSIREYGDPDAFWLEVRTELKKVISDLYLIRSQLLQMPPEPQPSDTTLTIDQLETTMSNPRYETDLVAIESSGWDLSTIMDVETILVVVGCFFGAELFDRPVADKLRDRIDFLGGRVRHRRAIVVTDAELQRNAGLRNGHPLICLGGPLANSLTKEIDQGALDAAKWTEGRLSCAFLAGPPPRVAIWGPGATDTRDSADRYMERPEGLESFLRLCWK